MAANTISNGHTCAVWLVCGCNDYRYWQNQPSNGFGRGIGAGDICRHTVKVGQRHCTAQHVIALHPSDRLGNVTRQHQAAAAPVAPDVSRHINLIAHGTTDMIVGHLCRDGPLLTSAESPKGSDVLQACL